MCSRIRPHSGVFVNNKRSCSEPEESSKAGLQVSRIRARDSLGRVKVVPPGYTCCAGQAAARENPLGLESQSGARHSGTCGRREAASLFHALADSGSEAVRGLASKPQEGVKGHTGSLGAPLDSGRSMLRTCSEL